VSIPSGIIKALSIKKIIALSVVLLLGALSYWFFFRSSDQKPEITFVTVPVERGPLRVEINSTGTVKPLVEVQVGSQVSGTIKTLYADFESEVKKDEIIALIDPDLYEAKMLQARADLEAARANLGKAEVTAADELRTLKRKETLIGKDSISQSDYDTAKTKSDAATAQIEIEKARIAQLLAKLNEAELQLKYTRILAPVNGVVTSRSMDIGQTVTAGFQTPVLFKIAEDLTRMQVHTNVDEADIGRVKVEQNATFTVPAFPDLIFKAKVSQIRNDPKIEQNVVTYSVILDVSNEELKLRPGMTANVQILVNEIDDTLMLPEQALLFTPSEAAFNKNRLEIPKLRNNQKLAWKLENKNNLKPIGVVVGAVGPQKSQIFSEELKQGDRVVVDAIVKKSKSGFQPPAFRFSM
jgi:HlyD family secretion protein